MLVLAIVDGTYSGYEELTVVVFERPYKSSHIEVAFYLENNMCGDQIVTSSTFLAVSCPTAHGGDGFVHIYHIDSIIRNLEFDKLIQIDPNDNDSFQVGS
jgi:hypothetical protein